MITIIDYGLGNVSAFSNVYKSLNIPCSIAKTVDELKSAERVILPGVGAFDHAMRRLDDSGMRSTLEKLVFGKKIPLLGVCVGMQMLARSSDEGVIPGLGWVDASVKKFDSDISGEKIRIPHMGWNDVVPVANEGLFAGLGKDARFYFLHSYYVECERNDTALAEVEYGTNFTCAVRKDNVFGVQFHPEKSHHFGAQLLKNFSLVEPC